MGESDRYQEYKRMARRRFTLGQPGNALFALFAINVVVFFIIILSRVFFLSTHQGQGMEARNIAGSIVDRCIVFDRIRATIRQGDKAILAQIGQG